MLLTQKVGSSSALQQLVHQTCQAKISVVVQAWGNGTKSNIAVPQSIYFSVTVSVNYTILYIYIYAIINSFI